MVKYSGKENAKSGFTLIELLVVISIIGMLAATVLSATTLARYKAKSAALKREFQQLALALQLFYDNHGNTWGGNLGLANNLSPAPGLGIDSATSNPTSAGNYCPTAANSLFGDPEIAKILDSISKTFPNGTLECIYSNQGTAENATNWTVYFTAPASSGSSWNKWCMDNYRYTNNGWLQGNFNGSANRQIKFSILPVCGNSSDTPPNVSPYASPDW